MAYNREDIFNLPMEEKYELAMDLWDDIENNLLEVTEEEIKFAKERLELHRLNPSKGTSWQEVKKKISEKYGF